MTAKLLDANRLQIFSSVAVIVSAFMLASTVSALTPAPDGGYPNANTAEGDFALQNLTNAANNTAVGDSALRTDVEGSLNTAVGSGALRDTTTESNTAVGAFALATDGAGAANTAVGASALFSNDSGHSNVAVGVLALENVVTGGFNTAVGTDALKNSTTDSNTAVGFSALENNVSGAHNIAVGDSAGKNLTTGDNNIDIGNLGISGEANTIHIGTQGTQTAAFMAGIVGSTVSNPAAVVIDSNGKLGTSNVNNLPGARFQGELVFLAHGSPPPAGFTLIASGDVSIGGNGGKKHRNNNQIDVDVYQRN